MKTMQKLVFIFVFFFTASIAYGQGSNVRKAESALQKGDLEEAMQLISEATQHEKTKDDPKTWYTKGLVHKAMIVGEDGNVKDLSQLDEALEAFDKAKSLDKENGTYVVFGDTQVDALWSQFINAGAQSYQDEDLEKALENFTIATELKPEDTTAFLYAGIAAQELEMWEKTLENYYKLIDLGYEKKDIYNSVIYIERVVNKDNEQALKVMRQARETFPNDNDLLKEEITLLINSEQVDEAEEKLKTAIQAEPDNDILYFTLAFMYDQTDRKDLAIENYEKALELKPESFETNFNLAGLHYNRGADLIKQANEMDLKDYQKNGKALVDKSQEAFKKALPYLEKAHQLKPEDTIVLETLQTV